MTIQIHGPLASTNVRRVALTASELGLEWESVSVDLLRGEHKQPAYLKLNPTGRVPAIVDGDIVLWESNAILFYLAEKARRLLPSAPGDRALVLQWLSWRLGHLVTATGAIQFERFMKPAFGMGETDEAVVERELARFHREMKVLDAHLADRAHLVGGERTIADLAVATDFTLAGPARFPMEEYGNVQRWLAAISELPSWQQTLPQG